jgi:hypothetical protein
LEIEKLQLQETTDDDLERETTYKLAEDLNESLGQMEASLKKIVNELNMNSEVTPGDDSNPVEKVMINNYTFI